LGGVPVFMCVRVCLCGVPCCAMGSYPGLFGRGGWSCLCMTHMKQSPSDPADTFLKLRFDNSGHQ